MKMGCAYSKTYDANPRIFHVWNVDSDGHYLKPGKIEVTDSQLILYQKPSLVVQWPLTRIRRYGFDSEVFSFECGRRCTTGAGVYAFKCKRAQQLFTILQESINSTGRENSNTNNNSAPALSESQNNSVATSLVSERLHSTSSVLSSNGHFHNVSPIVDSSGYLQPNTTNSFTDQMSSQNDSSAVTGSPGSYVCIHSPSDMLVAEGGSSEWPGLPRSFSGCCSLASCRSAKASSASAHQYVNTDVVEQNAVCSNRMCIVNQYVNASAVIPDKCCLLEQNANNTYVNGGVAVTSSPGHLSCSGRCLGVNCTQCADFNTNYAKLDDLLKQEKSAKQFKEQHCYVNVRTDPPHSESSTSSKCVSGRSTPTDILNKCGTLTSPTSPGSVKGLCHPSYANLGSPTTSQGGLSRDQVTYAVLDLEEANNGSVIISPVSTQNGVHSVASSPVKLEEGYAQIDFDKTKALSNSTNHRVVDFNDDSMRKTRHNAAVSCDNGTT